MTEALPTIRINGKDFLRVAARWVEICAMAAPGESSERHDALPPLRDPDEARAQQNDR